MLEVFEDDEDQIIASERLIVDLDGFDGPLDVL